jgi:sterol O-acyltransferase
MIMKMHSYITLNWQLQSVSKQSREIFDSLKEKTKAIGGWDKALADAIAKKTELQFQASASTTHASSTREPTPIGTPPVAQGSSTAIVDVSTASALRQRLSAVASLPRNGSAGESGPHTLIHHPDPEISAMAKDYLELQSELTSSGPHHVTWPNNISWKNFAMYQLIPTLVYDLEYPRTDRSLLFVIP